MSLFSLVIDVNFVVLIFVVFVPVILPSFNVVVLVFMLLLFLFSCFFLYLGCIFVAMVFVVVDLVGFLPSYCCFVGLVI